MNLEADLLRQRDKLYPRKQADLGAAVGVTDKQISKYFTNDGGIPLSRVEAFLSALGRKVVPSDVIAIEHEHLLALYESDRIRNTIHLHALKLNIDPTEVCKALTAYAKAREAE